MSTLQQAMTEQAKRTPGHDPRNGKAVLSRGVASGSHQEPEKLARTFSDDIRDSLKIIRQLRVLAIVSIVSSLMAIGSIWALMAFWHHGQL